MYRHADTVWSHGHLCIVLFMLTSPHWNNCFNLVPLEVRCTSTATPARRGTCKHLFSGQTLGSAAISELFFTVDHSSVPHRRHPTAGHQPASVISKSEMIPCRSSVPYRYPSRQFSFNMSEFATSMFRPDRQARQRFCLDCISAYPLTDNSPHNTRIEWWIHVLDIPFFMYRLLFIKHSHCNLPFCLMCSRLDITRCRILQDCLWSLPLLPGDFRPGGF
jgi:hypothetical protein